MKAAKILLIEVGKKGKVITIEADESGSFLSKMQELVGGYIEPFNVLNDSPCIYVNGDGMMMGLEPNRAVYASKEMEETGYLSQIDFSRVVKEGELYSILFGNIIAVSYDDDGELQDISDEEVERVNEIMGDEASGIIELLLLKARSNQR